MGILLPSWKRIRSRGPFAFPGTTPRFDPAHFAGSTIRAFSGMSFVCLGGGYIDIITGRAFTNGTNTSSIIDATLGKALQTNSSATPTTLGGNSTTTITAATYAVLVRPLNSGTGSRTYFVDGGTNGLGVQNTDTNMVFFSGALRNAITGATVANNFPYFMALSTDGSSLLHGVTVNLLTGIVKYATGTPLAFTSPTSTYSAGGENGSSFPAQANLAAGMYAPNILLSKAKLLAWAADPWSFWYPQ